MSTVRKQGFSIADFRALPEVRPVLEFFGGRVMQKTSPRLPHSVIQGEMYTALQVAARPNGIGRAYLELRCDFGGGSFVFDLSFFVQGRRPRTTNPQDVEKIVIPPDLAIEILSPGQTIGELSLKLRSAIRRGVRLGWMIHDRRREVHVFWPSAKPRTLRVGDVLDGGDVLPGFALPVSELFGWLDD